MHMIEKSLGYSIIAIVIIAMLLIVSGVYIETHFTANVSSFIFNS